jgi:hypothetical protein
MKSVMITLFVFSAALFPGGATADPQTRENAKGITIEVSGIGQNPEEACQTGHFRGRIVKQDFAEDSVTLTAITVEDSDGLRQFINVEIPTDMTSALRGRVFNGLQRLSKVGRRASGQVYYCGAAGRFAYLNEIR